MAPTACLEAVEGFTAILETVIPLPGRLHTLQSFTICDLNLESIIPNLVLP